MVNFKRKILGQLSEKNNLTNNINNKEETTKNTLNSPSYQIQNLFEQNHFLKGDTWNKKTSRVDFHDLG